MIVYNVTVKVEDEIKTAWLDWMQNEHIPEVMACGIFIKAQMSRIIMEEDSENTFAISYTCATKKVFDEYKLKFAEELQKKHINRFGDKAIAFRTLMEVIKEF